MSTVTTMTHSVTFSVISKLFNKYLSVYGNGWGNRHKTDAEWKESVQTWLDMLKDFDIQILRKAFASSLLLYKDFPPTLGQLVDLCLKETGVPNEDQIIKCMINRDFNHPMVKMIYDKIGSWALSNGKADEIKAKTKSSYSECLNNFRTNPKTGWEALDSYKSQLALEAPIPDKIPSSFERKSFKQRMDEYYKIAAEEKAKLKDKVHPEFDKQKINKGGEQFDEYCAYLLSVPDNQVLSLPPVYAYDRQRLLNAKETQAHLRESGYVPTTQRQGTEAPRQSTGRPTKVYKAWIND